jgi:dTDP-4-dehydrorhamnose reductase
MIFNINYAVLFKSSCIVNAITPGEVANWCKKHDAVLIHYSTDYVFDGTKGFHTQREMNPTPLIYMAGQSLKEKEVLKKAVPLI